LTAKPIAGTEGSAMNPFFSPDGKWIGYFSGGKLKKISANGGVPVVLCDLVTLWGAWWNENNTIVGGQWAGDIMRISANGGTKESIVKWKSGNLTDPQVLPDGKSMLCTSSDSSGGQQRIMLLSLKSGERRELFPGFGARYLPTGHLIYMSPNNTTLFAVSFNLDRLEVKGAAVKVLEGVGRFDISASGTLAYIPGTPGGTMPQTITTLVWVDRAGKEEPLSADPNDYWLFRISPDGKKVALTIGPSPKQNIWIWDVVHKTMMRLTLEEGTDNTTPLWTPDGKRIVYTASRENVLLGDLYWRAADGTGEVEKLASSPGRGLLAWSWSGDGKNLLSWEWIPSPMQSDVVLFSMEGDRKRKPLLYANYWESQPRISPDGAWMAYTSTESGKIEIYIRPFPDAGKGKWQVSSNGGDSPLWSSDGRELFYHSGDAAMAVPVETDKQFKYGTPTVLFRRYIARPSAPGFALWDISPDGKRFLMLKEAKPTTIEGPRKINVVVNWIEELKQKVPTK